MCRWPPNILLGYPTNHLFIIFHLSRKSTIVKSWMWCFRDSVSKWVSRYYLTNICTVPILYSFQIFIQIIELICVHLQRKINVIHHSATCCEVFLLKHCISSPLKIWSWVCLVLYIIYTLLSFYIGHEDSHTCVFQ